MKTSGVWYVSASGNTEEKHFPSGVSNGWLQIYAFNGEVKQLLYRFGTANTNDYQIFVRTFYTPSQSWSNWTRLITNMELAILPSKDNVDGDDDRTDQAAFSNIPYIRLLTGGTGLIIGFKSGDAYAAQMRLSYFTGLSYRTKKTGTWSEWKVL